MGFFDELKTWARGDDEDEELEEMTARPSRNNKPTEPDNEFAEQAARRNDRVVNINTTAQLSVVLANPEKFENAAEVADHLRDRRDRKSVV